MKEQQSSKILIVEDEESFRRIYKDVLSHAGFSVLEASDGEEGLNSVQNNHPDIVLLDIVMPKLSGLDLLKKLRETEEFKKLPVILFSVMGDTEDIKKGLAFGANDYTIKGVHSPNEIVNKVKNILALNKTDNTTSSTSAQSYKLVIKEREGDAVRISDMLGMKDLMKCPQCGSRIIVEIKKSPQQGFEAEFKCEKCYKIINP